MLPYPVAMQSLTIEVQPEAEDHESVFVDYKLGMLHYCLNAIFVN